MVETFQTNLFYTKSDIQSINQSYFDVNGDEGDLVCIFWKEIDLHFYKEGLKTYNILKSRWFFSANGTVSRLLYI